MTAVVTTCVAAGQSVLVASTNNEAVDVVAKRCDDIAPGLLMRTGNSEAREREAAKLEALLTEPTGTPPRGSTTVGGQLRVSRVLADRQRAEAAQRVGEEGRLLDLLREREQRAAALELPVPFLESAWAAADDGVAALDRWEHRARKAVGAPWWLFGSWRRRRALAVLFAAPSRPTPPSLTGEGTAWPGWLTERPVPSGLLESVADAVAVERELRDLVPHHTGWDEEGLKQTRLETAGELSALSSELSRAVSTEVEALASDSMGQRLQSLRSRSGYRRSQKKLMVHIKGWAISTHSVQQLELSPKLFDLVVIDEASQCSIPSILPLLFRARRALIIGDPMQLGHIPGVSPQQERQARVRTGLSAAQLEDRRLAYHVYSAYHVSAQHGESPLLLDEHYRCHPEIAGIVNGYCYAGQLQVLTDTRRQVPASDPVGAAEPVPVLGWVDVPYGESVRGGGGQSWRNEAEAVAVRRVVDELLRHLPPDATVGVVTPFKAQKEWLARLWCDDDRVRVGTVHAFQGGQRDVMVLSPVATHNTPPRTTHWVASQVNLWNVAITRTKSQLITVGGHVFWQGQSGLPALLANRSVPLGAGVGAANSRGGRQGGGTAGRAPEPRFREELADRLQQYLTERGITDLERATVVGGHVVDVLFTAGGQNTAVLLDPGPPRDRDPARHLRLTHARADLLPGLPSGGYGAKFGPVDRTVRVPAWRVLAGEALLDPLFD